CQTLTISCSRSLPGATYGDLRFGRGCIGLAFCAFLSIRSAAAEDVAALAFWMRVLRSAVDTIISDGTNRDRRRRNISIPSTGKIASLSAGETPFLAPSIFALVFGHAPSPNPRRAMPSTFLIV